MTAAVTLSSLAAGLMLAAMLLGLAACSGMTPPPTAPAPAATPVPAEPGPLQLIRQGSALETAFASLSAGYNHACGLTETGRAVCWGLRYGELWPAPPEARFAELSAGFDFSCGLTYAGAIKCWGENRYDRVIGAPAGQFQAMDVGRFHGCALDAAGAPVCWGRNNDGQTYPLPPHARAALTKIEAAMPIAAV